MPSVSAADLQRAHDDGARVVDVRTAREWRAGRLPYAEHLPLDELSARANEIDPEQLTVFVCRSGDRSAAATQAFAVHNFKVANLEGGMKAIRNAGIEIVADNGAQGSVI